MRSRLLVLLLVIFTLVILNMPVFGAGTQYKIAVLPFDDGSIQDRWWEDEGGWDVGKGVASELITELMKTNRFRLIEREKIDKILEEQDLGTGGRIDTTSAAKIGKILGVQYLVMGRVTDFSLKSSGFSGLGFSNTSIGLGVKNTKANVGIDARLVDTGSAEIIASVTGKGNKSNTNLDVAVDWNAISIGSDEFRQTNLGIAMREAVASVAKQLAEKAYSGDRGSPQPEKIAAAVAYSDANKVIINIGSGSGIKPGMVFIVQHVMNVVKDPATGEIIDEVTEPVAEIRVTEVKAKSATCTVLDKLSSNYEITVGDKVDQK